jgi:hypothetical protein
VGNLAWLASVREAANLLTDEFLPEFLLVSVLVIAMLVVRRLLRRDARPN